MRAHKLLLFYAFPNVAEHENYFFRTTCSHFLTIPQDDLIFLLH